MIQLERGAAAALNLSDRFKRSEKWCPQVVCETQERQTLLHSDLVVNY
jgi:hypothetical protein